MSALVIRTVGHSNRSLDDFVGLLRAHGIARLADVRRYPGSRRHPQFDRAALGPALERAGVAYRHFEALGGMRECAPGSPHVALAEPAFRGYADHMGTAAFAVALDDLVAWAGGGPTTVMCAERLPDDCHRAFLADALLVRGVGVLHLLDAATTREHALHADAVREGARLVYRGAQETLGL